MKYIFSIFLSITLAAGASAQPGSNFLEIDAGYDSHKMFAKLSTGSNSCDGGLMLYAGFGHHFTSRWGIAAGLRLCGMETAIRHNFTDSVGTLPDSELLLDSKYRDLDVDYLALKEVTRETLLSLPIAAIFRQPLGKRLSMEARVSLAPGVAFNQEFETESGQIRNVFSFYNTYDGEDVVIERLEELIGHGSGYKEGFSGSARLKKAFLQAGADISMVFSLTNRLALQAGLYGSCMVSDQKKNDCPHIYDGENFVGTLQSAVCGKVHPCSVGVSAGLRYYFGEPRVKLPVDTKPCKLEMCNPCVFW